MPTVTGVRSSRASARIPTDSPVSRSVVDSSSSATGRPVLMSREIAEIIGVIDRWVVTDPYGFERDTGVATVTEAELLTAGAARIEWNAPDADGNYTPTLYTSTTNG